MTIHRLENMIQPEEVTAQIHGDNRLELQLPDGTNATFVQEGIPFDLGSFMSASGILFIAGTEAQFPADLKLYNIGNTGEDEPRPYTEITVHDGKVAVAAAV